MRFLKIIQRCGISEFIGDSSIYQKIDPEIFGVRYCFCSIRKQADRIVRIFKQKASTKVRADGTSYEQKFKNNILLK